MPKIDHKTNNRGVAKPPWAATSPLILRFSYGLFQALLGKLAACAELLAMGRGLAGDS